jgi:hypothetical protein
MIRTVLALTLTMTSSAAAPIKPTYTGDAAVRVEFVTGFDEIGAKCGNGKPTAACVTWRDRKPDTMYLPNCCDPAWGDEDFARLCCHELRHVNGWPGDHPL